MNRRALSLVEILIVIAIVALLTALLLPVLSRAKSYAKQTPCISNQRQLYVAWSQYADEEDGVWPALLQQFASRPDLRSVLHCDADDFKGANPSVTKAMGFPVSYYYVMDPPKFRQDLLAADPNTGILFCVAHGVRVSHGLGLVTDPELDTSGTVIRTRLDGSAQVVSVPLYCSSPMKNGMTSCGRDEWYLLTEARPCPDFWCGGENIPQPIP